MPPALLDARELARELEASYEDVLSWTRLGLIPSIKTGGRYYYILSKVCMSLRKRGDAVEPCATEAART